MKSYTLAEFKALTGESTIRQCYSEKKGNSYFWLPNSEKAVGWSIENPPTRSSCYFLSMEDGGFVASSKPGGNGPQATDADW